MLYVRWHGHFVQDCPETNALIAAGVLRYDAFNKLVMADGSHLPRAPNGGGTVHLIHEQATNMRDYEQAGQDLGEAQRIPLNKMSSSTNLQYCTAPIDYSSDTGESAYEVFHLESCMDDPPTLPEAANCSRNSL